MTDRLFYRNIGLGPPLVILHGLFGASDNWMGIAKQLGDQFSVYLPDQRNHGQSFHHPIFNYEAMAEDLHAFVDMHELKEPIVVGHSMGGKVAMFYAQKYSNNLSKLVVVDIAPKAYPVHHQAILEGMNRIDLNLVKTRQDADNQLATFVPDIGVRQFLLKNLSRSPVEGFKWKLNLPVIGEQIAQVGRPLSPDEVIDKPTLFLRGEVSGYIEDSDLALIERQFPKAQLASIPGAGHWVHAQKPQLFLEALQTFITTS
ncbi:MAG: alpha/beta fold hydrolase [Cyclobacteriaceae bacterium]